MNLLNISLPTGLKRRDDKIPLIKLVRQISGLGLKEAISLVEDMIGINLHMIELPIAGRGEQGTSLPTGYPSDDKVVELIEDLQHYGCHVEEGNPKSILLVELKRIAEKAVARDELRIAADILVILDNHKRGDALLNALAIKANR